MNQSHAANRKMVLRTYPSGELKDSDFEIVEAPLPELSEGHVLIRIIYLTIDPYIRARMSDQFTEGYTAKTPLGEAVEGEVIGQVVTSKTPGFQEGDFVTAFANWQDFAAVEAGALRRVDPGAAPLQTALGALGMPGLTAWAGLTQLAAPTAGQTAFVSAVTGGVGTVASQMCRIFGARVVGVAGSEEKCAYAKEVMALDACVNRNAPDFAEQVKATCPDGIDFNFENAGGQVFWAAMDNMNIGGTMIMCGMMDNYNDNLQPDGPDLAPTFLRTIAVKRLHVHGIVVSDYVHLYPEFQAQVSGWIAAGKLRTREDVREGLENAPATLRGMLQGENFGKMLVRIGNDPTL